MHADELNLVMSDAFYKPIYHNHLHIVALPVVKKDILWSKRCNDKSLVGTVKETVNQISHSKKWKSPPALDDNGNQILGINGKPVLIPTYSILQDEFYEHMQKAGFKDFQRGERGSNEEYKKFISKVKQITELKELTPELIHEFIDKIVVYAPRCLDSKRVHVIDIYYNGVGILRELAPEEMENAFQQRLSKRKQKRHSKRYTVKI